MKAEDGTGGSRAHIAQWKQGDSKVLNWQYVRLIFAASQELDS